MGVVNFSEYLNSLIQTGSVVEGNVVRVVADNGRNIGDAVFKVIQGGNGVSSEVGINVQQSGGAAVSTGMAFLTIAIETVTAALLPAFGVVAGVGIYEISSGDTDFHNRVANALYEEGKTLGGNVIAYWNGSNLFLDEETIEIYKNALLDAQAFGNYEAPDYSDTGAVEIISSASPMELISHALSANPRTIRIQPALSAIQDFIERNYTDPKQICFVGLVSANTPFPVGWSPLTLWISEDPVDSITLPYGVWCKELQCEGGGAVNEGITLTGNTIEDRRSFPSYEGDKIDPTGSSYYSGINTSGEVSENLQPGAKIPSISPFQTTYPYWIPWEFPQTLPDPSELPTIYPIKYPGTEPDPYPHQDPAQNPDPEPAPDIYPEIIPKFPLPKPDPEVPTPEPLPEPDPDPNPGHIDPMPDPEIIDPTPDPIDPNPGPKPTPIIPVPILPETVSSNKLFTVYNPTASQLDQLGGYLWDSSIIAALRDIWQEPMDGLISLQQIYVTPVTSGSHNIILGFLNSGVSSAVVSQQFVTIDCGTVTVPEDKENATDYAPYTSLHAFLPFIGIVELDTNECMNSSINIKYKVDVYTGTCLAQIAVDREADMPNSPILYTYSGNCSQQIPLTSGNSTGLLTALIGGITSGLSVASGGGLGVVAGATIAGHSLTHEMFHVSHSGNLSANAGIMGQKKPYLIIGRRHCYDANSYNTIYGYPANKTVTLGNHSGYVKVKECHIKTVATQPEYERIVELLKDGVFL